MRKHSILLTFMVLICMFCFFAGCGGNNKEISENKTEAPKADKFSYKKI